ncbi:MULTISPECIES: hypothetical protein [unclassified Campylobacter]|uniref:hypothetical protein n=1 Tax=unclassified Campylobacter TaxID=2593542 RepID=UPI001BD94629|nr:MULTISPECIES: hypothetical protein [unclassified Campylobacter]MBT0879810.1 hypothetical protein [Campylobacter sp. 2018MI27]MBT0885176.1 hypothetical protein [Campylobacter sp. 2018MI10]
MKISSNNYNLPLQKPNNNQALVQGRLENKENAKRYDDFVKMFYPDTHDSLDFNYPTNSNEAKIQSMVIYMLLEHQDALYGDMYTNTIYERAFSSEANQDVQKDLKDFLKEHSDSLGDYKWDQDVIIAKLFNARNISEDEFKQRYLARIDEIKQGKEHESIQNSENTKPSDEILTINKNDEKSEDKKPFEAIEVKGTSTRESMEEILSKINIQNIKDERDLLAILMAYKDSKNLYDKRV